MVKEDIEEAQTIVTDNSDRDTFLWRLEEVASIENFEGFEVKSNNSITFPQNSKNESNKIPLYLHSCSKKQLISFLPYSFWELQWD